MIIGNEKSVSCVTENARKRRAERGRASARRPGSRAHPTPTGSRRAARRRARNAVARDHARGSRSTRTNPPNSSRRPDRRRDDAVVEAHPLHAREHRPHRLRRPRAASRSRRAGRARRTRGSRAPPTEPECASTRSPSPRPIAARNSAGCTNVVNASPRHSRRNTRALRARRRAAAAASRTCSVLFERAAGEDEEHVFEARPPHEHRRGAEAVRR